MDIRYSLIIPTFNSSHDLESLLSSCFFIKEELEKTEVLVIDDGSYDDTQDIVACFYDRIDHLNYHYQKNRGPAAARNLGARNAKGSYLIFVDDDCIFPKGSLQSIKDFYVSNAHYSGVGIKTTNSSASVFSEFNQRLGDYLINVSKISEVGHGYVSSRCYSFTKDSFWELNGHDEDFIWPAAEDRDLCLRMQKKNMLFGYIQTAAVINTDHLRFKGFIRQNFFYGLGAGLFKQKHPDIKRTFSYTDMVSHLCRDRSPVRAASLFWAFCLAQLSSLTGFFLYKISYDVKNRPPCVFLPPYAIFMEIVKNFILWFPLTKLLKKHAGSLTTGEELLSVGYMVNLAQKTMDTYKQTILKVFQDEDWIAGKRVLEIGPGSHLAVPLLFIAEGAQEVVSIDKYGEVKFREKEMQVYKEAALRLPVAKQGIIKPLLNDLVSEKIKGINSHRINYFPDIPIDGRGITKLLGEETFDLIVSFNTMEHIKDAETCFKNMKRLLKKGGIYIHRIDGASHYHLLWYTKNKLSQFVFSNTLFDLMFSNRSAPTRRLLNDYIKIAQATGMEIDQNYIDELASDNELNNSFRFLHPKYRQLPQEQLANIGFVIVAMKK